ncbi:stage II sporulation protein M [Halogeometricum borinquense]|uniref:stage II sporulation protein M n=1 Tax=Halogeometricum borinquense TaxID=60847 RepID=UPI00344599EF
MNISTALRAGVRMLSERSASVLPVYLLTTGLFGIARIPIMLAGLAALALISIDGRLENLLTTLKDIDLSTIDSQSPPPEMTKAMESLISPEIVLLLLAGVLISLILAFVASVLARATVLNAIVGLLRDEDGVRAAIVGARENWLSFLGVRFLLFGALAVVTVPIGILGLGLIAVAGAVGVVGMVLGGLFSLLLVLIVLALFAFAEQAIVVDDVGTAGAIRQSVKFPFRRPGAFVGYIAVALGVGVIGTAVLTAASFSEAPRVTALVGLVLLRPVLDGFKTALYAERDLSAHETPSPGNRVWQAFGGGLRALGAFVRDHPLANVASAIIFGAGIVGGWATTAPYGPSLPVQGEISNVFGSLPVGTFVNLAVNNWLVAVDTAYSGVAVGVPSVVNLVFNGVLIGALGGVFDPTAFTALVAPHGIIEVPTLVLGGGLGLWLGGVGYRTARGQTDADGLAAALRRTYRVLLGLVPLFVVAAFIEAFLTPAIASVIVG